MPWPRDGVQDGEPGEAEVVRARDAGGSHRERGLPLCAGRDAVELSRGRTTLVPTFLPRLPARQALATIALPLHLNWSHPTGCASFARSH